MQFYLALVQVLLEGLSRAFRVVLHQDMAFMAVLTGRFDNTSNGCYSV